MASRKRAQTEPTDDWQQLQFHLDWIEQTRYELIRPVIVFDSPPNRARAADWGFRPYHLSSDQPLR